MDINLDIIPRLSIYKHKHPLALHHYVHMHTLFPYSVGLLKDKLEYQPCLLKD